MSLEIVARWLDMRGHPCPLPLLRSRLALEDMAMGEVLGVLSTDKGSKRDFAIYAQEAGHGYQCYPRDGHWCLMLRRNQMFELVQEERV